jgi:hypothetical protein
VTKEQEFKALKDKLWAGKLEDGEHERMVRLSATVRRQVTIGGDDLSPTGESYDRWQDRALWALGQIALNPDSNQWTIIAAEIEEAVQEALQAVTAS